MPNKRTTEATIDELQKLIDAEKSKPAQDQEKRDINLCSTARKAFSDFVDFNTWYAHRQNPVKTADRLIETIQNCLEITKDSQHTHAAIYRESIQKKLGYLRQMQNGSSLHQILTMAPA